MRAFSYSQVDQWREFHAFRNGPPPSGDDHLYAWIHALHVSGPFEAKIGAGFDRVQRQHTGSNEAWLGISGPAHLGKTRAVTNVLMTRALAEPDRWRTRSKGGGLHTPYLYVEAASNQEARGLLASIARGCGLPDQGSEKDLHGMLTAVLPQLGTRLIVVDDAQMFRRRSENASRVTDGLRVALHLPVPFVFVGIDLHSSALLYRSTRNNDTARQLERRHIPLVLRALDRSETRPAMRLIAEYKKKVIQIAGLDATAAFSDLAALAHVVGACEGRPGSLLSALKRATTEALATNAGTLTADLLVAEVEHPDLATAAEGA